MRAHWIVGLGVVLLLIAGCGKPKFDDPNVDDQYYVYLEDQETHQIVSDQVLYTMYKNGTKLCGYAIVESEDQCYKLLEAQFYTELTTLKQNLEQEAAQAEAYEQQNNLSNGTAPQAADAGQQSTDAAQTPAPSTPPAGTPSIAHGSSQGDATQ